MIPAAVSGGCVRVRRIASHRALRRSTGGAVGPGPSGRCRVHGGKTGALGGNRSRGVGPMPVRAHRVRVSTSSHLAPDCGGDQYHRSSLSDWIGLVEPRRGRRRSWDHGEAGSVNRIIAGHSGLARGSLSRSRRVRALRRLVARWGRTPYDGSSAVLRCFRARRRERDASWPRGRTR